MFGTYNVRTVSTPFGINGLECYKGGGTIDAPHVLKHVPWSVAGGAARGVKQMIRHEQQTNMAPNRDNPTFLASLHQKGRLLVWDADTLEVVGTCHHPNCSVVQCIVTPTYLFVRVEVEADSDSDADAKVYLWHTKTLELFRQLVAHDGRVMSLAVSDQADTVFATSGADHIIHIWNLSKSNMTPVRRITTHGKAVVSLFFHGIVLGGHVDAPLSMWDVETGEEVKKVKDTGNVVTVLHWLHDPKRIANLPKRSTKRFALLLVGFSDGYISEWALDTSTGKVNMVFKWGQKTHRAYINDLCGDEDVVLSCSAVDGAFLLSPTRGRLASIASYGVRVGLIDTLSKQAVLGLDNGSVKVFSYAQFAAGEGEPTMMAAFAPHTSGITGLFLELREDHTWDRLICSAADGTIVFTDFTKSRGTRSLNRISTQSISFIPDSGAFLVPMPSGDTISVIDQQTLAPFSKGSKLNVGGKVTVIRWVGSSEKVLVGCEGGVLFLFQVTMSKDRTPSFQLDRERRLVPFSPRGISAEEANEDLVVVNLQKNTQWNEGAFLIVNTRTEDVAFRVHLLGNVFPYRSSLVTFTGSTTYNYTVILQLRDGAIVQYVGSSVSKEAPVFVRSLIPSFILCALYTDASDLTPYPSQYILSVLRTATDVPDLKMICVERKEMKQLSFSAVSGGQVSCSAFEDKRSAVFGGDSSNTTVSLLVELQAIQQGELGFAVLRESPYVDILSMTGDYLYRISYGGDVLNYQAATIRRRSRNFLVDAVFMGNSPNSIGVPNPPSFACVADFCAATRYLALGYHDGLVQLFDTTQRIIFSRFSMHTRKLTSLWAFPHNVFFTTSDGSCCGAVVFRRTMFGDKDAKQQLEASSSLLRRSMETLSTPEM